MEEMKKSELLIHEIIKCYVLEVFGRYLYNFNGILVIIWSSSSNMDNGGGGGGGCTC